MNKPAVLLIYTGGTIGMIKDHDSGELRAFDFDHLYEQVPELSRIEASLNAISMNPIDSSEMNPTKWNELATIIFSNYHNYDGFVVLHGSDTMAYTASALSYMIQGIQKPIIFTGSQLPIGTIRTDGKENLITAIEIAAQKGEDGYSLIQEIAIYFEYSLYRGCRTTKVSANAFEAFKSPNYPNLAEAGVEIKFNYRACARNLVGQLQFKTELSEKVALVKIFPGFLPNIYKGIFDIQNVKGVVLETFGSGNAPKNKTFIKMLHDYIQAGGVVINVTQCFSGEVVQGKYANSSFFNDIGVISGRDMTSEAAITKLMYVLANYNSTEAIKKQLTSNLVGEISEFQEIS